MREDDPQRKPSRPLSAGRAAGTIGAAFALAAVVVVASRADRPRGSVDTGGQTTSTVVINGGLLVLAIVAAGMVATMLFAFQPGRSNKPQPRTGPKLLGQLLAFALLCVFVLALVAVVRGDRNGGRPRSAADTVAQALQSMQADAIAKDRDSVDWLPAGIVFAGTLAALAAAGVMIMRRQTLPEPKAALAARLARIFDDTLDDLHAEQDPRRAVIAAYARMERMLGHYGMERRPSEAPHEYVSRVLEQVVASGSSVRRLTRLYERARFSPHDIDPAMKADAISAVQAVRDELLAVEAEALVVAPQ